MSGRTGQNGLIIDNMKNTNLLVNIIIWLTVAFISCSENESNGQLIIEESVPVTDYDGNAYRTVRIGDQTWMAENIKSEHYSDGAPVESYIYNDDQDIVNVYGRLYKWAAVIKNATGSGADPAGIQGVCPVGWHVPDRQEWEKLINYLGGPQSAGGLLKEKGTEHWTSPNTDATNESLFTSLPGGMLAFWSEYQWLNYHSVFSSSTDNSLPGHPAMTGIKVEYNSSSVIVGDFHPSDGLSVRCVKNR